VENEESKEIGTLFGIFSSSPFNRRKKLSHQVETVADDDWSTQINYLGQGSIGPLFGALSFLGYNILEEKPFSQHFSG